MEMIIRVKSPNIQKIDKPTNVNLFPTTCNICGGEVIYTTNDKIYGKKYGSGYCYLCTKCGAYVGTHEPMPEVALGLLANKQMRIGKMMCHDLFDGFWQGKKKASSKRQRLYKYLAKELDIPIKDCHFGYFDLDMLRKAYKVLYAWKTNGLDWNKIQKDIGETGGYKYDNTLDIIFWKIYEILIKEKIYQKNFLVLMYWMVSTLFYI